MSIRLCALILLGQLYGLSAIAAGTDEFPGRKSFPAVPYVELEQLHQKRDKVVIVDVRTAYEFDTLRIKGALNINVHDAGFLDAMRKLRDENPDKELVTYCNGRTCNKSYEAVQKCRNIKLDKVIAYDAGILDWAQKYPLEAELLGRSPVDPKKLISAARFKEHLLDPKKFADMVGHDNVIVLDVRDRFQREASSLFPGTDKHASLDDKVALDRYFARAKKDRKTLLIYDAAGKQAEWLMYYIEDQGVPSYYFMKGGTDAYYKELRKEFAP